MEKIADNQYPIHDLLKSRWSPRAFSARAVENSKLFSLFEGARWSPSGGNLQPWSFIISTTRDEEGHSRFLSLLAGGNARWAKTAPVLVVAVAKIDRSEGQPNFWALYDLGQAVAHLSLQANALGLAVHQMGGFDREKTREQAHVPQGFEPVTMIAIGYPGNADELPNDLRQRELEVRTRKPLSEFVFAQSWAEPFPTALEE